MSLVVDAHQHFWTYGTYQTSWMEAPPYAGDPAFQPLRRSFRPDDLVVMIDTHVAASCREAVELIQRLEIDAKVRIAVLRGDELLEFTLKSEAGERAAEDK